MTDTSEWDRERIFDDLSDHETDYLEFKCGRAVDITLDGVSDVGRKFLKKFNYTTWGTHTEEIH